MTRAAKIEVHLEVIIFEDLPAGTRLNGEQLQKRIAQATPEQKRRAYERALVRCPLLLDDEKEGITI